MDIFIDGFGTFTSPLVLTSVTYVTTTYTTGQNLKIDKDWMPYNHFEYEPLWHKKFARIKYQMSKMWG